jgi:hypothetical protein
MTKITIQNDVITIEVKKGESTEVNSQNEQKGLRPGETNTI